MKIVPAVDLLDGQVVRLIEGDFERKTVFSGKTPVELLTGFVQTGAKMLHLVDLSGARSPDQRQTQLLESIVQSVDAEIQVGGGIRKISEVNQLLETGASRVVIGSLIVTEPQTALAALENLGPDRLTFALDVRMEESEPLVMSHGWQKSTGQNFRSVIAPFLKAGLRRVLCTDIAKDGRMQGPNVDLYRSLVQEFPELEIQASGGVSNLEDLNALSLAGAHSVVVGRALLSGAIDLTEAMNHVK
jgi:phosphoribosylformimino-5-aminoimidazole carboxamide ribotide isomerase